jgi:NCS1 family nucleobase:cation symporter-1
LNPVEIGPVPEAERTQSPLDLFLIWAGANIVATTFAVGASLAASFDTRTAVALMVAGSFAGAAMVAALAPLGPRLGVPSIIVARAALGVRGAGLIAVLMYVVNFAWIAINNVIAASACAALWGGPESERWWAFGMGVLSTLVVAGGPAWVARTDRIAVPLLFALSLVMTAACLRLEPAPIAATAGGLSLLRGFDVVFGYQASWILMFADYSRYTRTERGSLLAVFLGLGLTSAWLMPLGYLAARAASSPDPAAMLDAVGLGVGGGLLMSFGTLTTNFVNIYLSALAWKSLLPRSSQQTALWVTGMVGALLSLLSRAWLDRYADFMLVLGGAFVPVGGILIARFFLVRRPVEVAELYAARGGFGRAGVAAWALGALAYYAIGASGGTLPALAVATLAYAALARKGRAAALSGT